VQQLISRDEVAAAMKQLAGEGKKPSATAIRAVLGRGSLSTVIKLKGEIESAVDSPPESEEGRRLFQKTWETAVAEGRRQVQEHLETARIDLQTAVAEVERLEGDLVGLRAANDAMQIELRQARAEAAAASEQALAARAANESAANERAALSTQIAELYRSHAEAVAGLNAQLTAAQGRAHRFEVELARAQALLDVRQSSPAAG
jgi:gamma-glutamylcysteine synthetase